MKPAGRRVVALVLGAAFPVSLAAAAQTPAAARTPAGRKVGQAADPLGSLLKQAEAALARNDFVAATEHLRSYLAQRPDDATAHFSLGYAYSELSRWEDARAEYSKAIALNPKMAAAYLNLGRILLVRNAAAAVEAFRSATDLLPDQSQPQFLLGLALEQSGKLAAAIEAYETARQLDENSFDAHFALGRALLKANRAPEAEIEFRQATALRSDSAVARLWLVNSLEATQKPEEAAAALASYLELKPQDQDARLQLASLLVKLGRNDQALAELDRTDSSPQPSLASSKLRAEILLRQKKWTEAAAVLRKALELAPQDAELHAWLGRLLLEEKDLAAAEPELRRAFALDPKSTDALRDLASVYYLAENYPATLATLDELAQREKSQAGVWFIRATCYDKLGRKAEAIGAYEKFLAEEQGHNDTREFQARQRIRILRSELEKRK